jgi:hypothetical protein
MKNDQGLTKHASASSITIDPPLADESRRATKQNPPRRPKNYARQFWEAAFCGAAEVLQYSVETSTEYADQSLSVWRERWNDDGSTKPLPPSRQIGSGE